MDFMRAYFLGAFFALSVGLQAVAAEIFVPPVVALAINAPTGGGLFFNANLGKSDFTHELNVEDLVLHRARASSDYLINGAIYSNCDFRRRCGGLATRMKVEIFPTRVELQNGLNRVYVDLRGIVGSKSIGGSRMEISDPVLRRSGQVAGLPWQADLQLVGDIDESQLDLRRTAPGAYTGAFNVTVSIL